MFRSTVYIKSSGEPEVTHIEGELVEVDDKHSPTGRGWYVRYGGMWLQKLTGDWRVHRWEALTRAAEELEGIADKMAAKAAELRREAEESRAAPGPESGSVAAAGSAPPAVAT